MFFWSWMFDQSWSVSLAIFQRRVPFRLMNWMHGLMSYPAIKKSSPIVEILIAYEAATLLQKHGYRVCRLIDGLPDWQGLNLPV